MHKPDIALCFNYQHLNVVIFAVKLHCLLLRAKVKNSLNDINYDFELPDHIHVLQQHFRV